MTRLKLTLLCILLIIPTCLSQADAAFTPFQLVFEMENIADFTVYGHQMAVADTNGIISLWDIPSRTQLFQLDKPTPESTYQTMALSDQYLAAGFSDKARVWNIQTGELVYEYDAKPVQPLAKDWYEAAFGVDSITVSDALMATANRNDATVLLHNVETGKIIYKFSGHANNLGLAGIWEVVLSPDGSLLATKQWSGRVTIWETMTGKKRFQAYSAEAVAFSSDGSKLATGFARLTGSIYIWDILTGEAVTSFPTLLDMTQLEWSSDDQIIFSLSHEGILVGGYYYYTPQSVRATVISTGEEKHVFGLFEPIQLPYQTLKDEILMGIGVAHGENHVLLWNEQENDVYNRPYTPFEPLQTYNVAVAKIYSFDVNDEIIVVTYDNGVVVWDIEMGDQLQWIVTGIRTWQIRLAGQFLITLSEDSKLRIYQ